MTISKATVWKRARPRTKLARWENAVRVLEALTPEQREAEFDMSVFGERSQCGTSACAAGHCSLDPWFRKRGFKGRWHKTDKYGYLMEELRFPRNMKPHHFFGGPGTHEIFYNGMYRSVERVIREMQNYIEVLKYELTGGKHGQAKK